MEDWINNFRGLHFSFKITEENNKLGLYTGYLEDEFPYTQLKDKVTEVLGLSDISSEKLNHEISGPIIIETYRKLSTEESQTDGCHILLMDYVHSPFGDSESYHRILTGLKNDDIQSILKQFNSKCTTNKFSPGAHIFNNLSEVLSRGFRDDFEIRGRIRPDHEYERSTSIIIESDDISLITKLRLGPQINVLRFDKKSFFYNPRLYSILGL